MFQNKMLIFLVSRFTVALAVIIFAHCNSPYCCFCNVFNYIIKKVQSGICLSTKHSEVLKNSFNCVRAFLIKLELGNVGFWGIPGENLWVPEVLSRLRRGSFVSSAAGRHVFGRRPKTPAAKPHRPEPDW